MKHITRINRGQPVETALECYLRGKAQAGPKLLIPSGVDFDVYLKSNNGSGNIFRLSKDEAVAHEALYIDPFGKEVSILSSKVEVHFKLKPEILKALSQTPLSN